MKEGRGRQASSKWQARVSQLTVQLLLLQGSQVRTSAALIANQVGKVMPGTS